MVVARASFLRFWLTFQVAILSSCAEGEPLSALVGTPDSGRGAVTSDGSADAGDPDGAASSDVTRPNSTGAGGTDRTVPIEADAVAEAIEADASVGILDAELQATDASDARPVESTTPDAAADSANLRTDANVVATDAQIADVNNDTVGDTSLVETGPLSPCSGLCANPVLFTNPFSSGALGTAATCHETIAPFQGFVCGNFVGPRTFAVNGVVVPCDGVARSPGIARNGGFCFQATAGNETSEYFNTY